MRLEVRTDPNSSSCQRSMLPWGVLPLPLLASLVFGGVVVYPALPAALVRYVVGCCDTSSCC
jgi:hypothetical protein